jgi:hypothetical protein
VCWKCGTSAEGVEDPTFVSADDAPPADPLDLDMPPGDEPIPGPAEDLVECYLARDLMEAAFLVDQLGEVGIPAVADTHDMHDALGSMNSGPRVRVRVDDLPRARAWLEEYDRHQRESSSQ